MRAVGVGGEGEGRLARRRWLCARPPRLLVASIQGRVCAETLLVAQRRGAIPPRRLRAAAGQVASEQARERAWMVGEVSRYPAACERARAGARMVGHGQGPELLPEKRRRTMTGKESASPVGGR